MKKTAAHLMGMLLGLGAMCLTARAEGTPKIQFDQTVYDFGKTSQVTTVSGIFKFKNVGDGILKMDTPHPSCGCTAAAVKPDTLPPGTAGIIPFTLNLGYYRGHLEKHITVKSNDPITPELTLTIKVDYTPAYELSPLMLTPNLTFGLDQTNVFSTVTRTDGKPLQITRLETSQPWISAAVLPSDPTNSSSAKISVVVKRDGSPRRFNEYVHIYTSDQSNTPSSSLYLYGEVSGQVSVMPEALYWSINNSVQTSANDITRHVLIRSANDQPLELRNPQSSVKGVNVELVPQEKGKSYELIARIDAMPTSTISGNVSVETSVAAQSKIELPLIINVYKP